MADVRHLIVNADDFGLSPGVNHGIIEAHERGIVTSASLMVRWSAAAEAAAYSRKRPNFSVGLHVDLAEWAYREETWVPLYEVVSADDPTGVSEEVFRQLVAFRDLTGKDPSHIDSHQHVHFREPVRSVLVEKARELGVPLRQCSGGMRYCGDFYGQTGEGSPLRDAITVGRFIEILGTLRGITELGCHPGFADDLNSVYRSERALEVRVLCDPRVRAAVVATGTELVSFGDGVVRSLGVAFATDTVP